MKIPPTWTLMEDSIMNHTTITETRSPGNQKMIHVRRRFCFVDPRTIVSLLILSDFDDTTYYENDGYDGYDDQTYADSRYGEYTEGDAYTQGDDYTQGQYDDGGYYDEDYYDNQYPDDGTYDQDYQEQDQATDDQWSSGETYDGSGGTDFCHSDSNAGMSAEEREYMGVDSDTRSTMEDLD